MDNRVNSHLTAVQPLVSVGLPTYNRPEGLRRALDCITGQTYRNLEIIVSDNASTDDQVEKTIREFMARDSRIQYFQQSENKGSAFNFRFVLEKANGEYFMWAADDDIWDREYVDSILNSLLIHEDCALGFSSFAFVDEDQKIVRKIDVNYSGKYAFWRLFKFTFYFNDGCFYGIYKKDVLRNAPLFPVWWGVNKKCPYNTAYPFLYFVLAKGNYYHANQREMFFKKLNHVERHYVPFQKNKIFSFLSYILRQVNLFYESLKQIHRSVGSTPLTMMVAPILALRINANISKSIIVVIHNRIIRLFQIIKDQLNAST